ncbi:MAG TPA: hypothetical protein VK892_14115 [Pyrinomonadaceae bacterium]|nr:hypothetical protein [Pyrinomonadaceae bacterium]
MMKNNPFSSRHQSVVSCFTRVAFLLLLTAHCSLLTIKAQEEKPKDLVPPPLAILSDIEEEKLNAEPDFNKRTQLAISLMDARLKRAEELSSQKNYMESLNELGGFQAIIRNTLNFLNRNNSGRKKVLNSFKRLEISLRQTVPRLEIVRREMPYRYSYRVREMMKFVREARSNAVEPIFSDSVLPGDN